MTPVDQTIVSSPDGKINGNCFTACIASLMDLPIEEVPYFAGMPLEIWFDEFLNFLKVKGYSYEGLYRFDKEGHSWEHLLSLSEGIDGYFICSGASWREYVTAGHAVIYKDGVMVHDPHFSKMGIKVLEDAWMIEKVA